jgi:hypothetical protein
VKLGGVSYSWRFLQADVKFSILGIGFLRHFQLIVDVVGSQLLQSPCRCRRTGGRPDRAGEQRGVSLSSFNLSTFSLSTFSLSTFCLSTISLSTFFLSSFARSKAAPGGGAARE